MIVEVAIGNLELDYTSFSIIYLYLKCTYPPLIHSKRALLHDVYLHIVGLA